MTNAMLTDLLQSLGLLGIFLLIGVFLRAKFKIFQKTFIPASVIGELLPVKRTEKKYKIFPASS